MVLSSWLMAARPFSLSLTAVPVAVGAALAWATDGTIAWLAVAAALAAGVLIHVGTNLHNDMIDADPGGYGVGRLGPPRATASGLLSAAIVIRGAVICFALAALAGIYLVWVGGWPILVLGLLSIAAGWTYSGGPYPIAYTPLSELFVLAFFGVGAVAGTYWLCTLRLDAAAIEAGLAVGFFAAAVLLVNNHRDVEVDAQVGRLTLPMVAGSRATRWLYGAFMLLPFALLPLLAHELPRGRVWPAALALASALLLIVRFAREPRGRGLNKILLGTVQLQILFSVLLCGGLLLPK